MFEGKVEKYHFTEATAEVVLDSMAFEYPTETVCTVCDTWIRLPQLIGRCRIFFVYPQCFL